MLIVLQPGGVLVSKDIGAFQWVNAAVTIRGGAGAGSHISGVRRFGDEGKCRERATGGKSREEMFHAYVHGSSHT